VPHRVDIEGKVIELPCDGPPLFGNIFLRWDGEVPFVTFRQVIVEDIPPNRLPEVETAVVRLNDLLDVPGFNLSHAERQLYYKVSVPAFEGVDPDVLGRVGAGVLNNVKEFAEAFRAVIGGRPGADVARLYETQVYRRRMASPFV
jgi:hypothetical protein